MSTKRAIGGWWPGGVAALWRGPYWMRHSCLGGDGVLCALHRRDSFLVLQPNSVGPRMAAYRWNGFGFSGVDDSNVLDRCKSPFGVDQ